MKSKSILEKIKAEFPGLPWKHCQVITNGWDNYVVILDKELVFRSPRNHKQNLNDEVKLLNYLNEKISVGIPEYTHISKDKRLAAYPFLQGKELSLSKFKKLSNSEKESFAKQIADFLTSLHSTPKSIALKFNIEIEDLQKENKSLIQKVRKNVFPLLNTKEIKILEDFIKELTTEVKNIKANTLTHGDLTLAHILWDNKKKKVNIIDFSDASFGDAAIDFAGLWELGPEIVKRIFDLYQGKKDRALLHRSSLYYKRIALYEMVHGINGSHTTFENGHKMFKKVFCIK